MSTIEFIQSTVSAARDKTPYTDGEVTLVVRLLTEWSSSRGLELTTEAILARENIASFIHAGIEGRAAATRADYRSKLLRVAEALLPPESAPRRLTPLQASDPSAPYTQDDQQVLVAWARAQKKHRRTDARVLLALGLGAGLSSAEIMNARASDVVMTIEGVVLIHVRETRPRVVPVLRKWEKVLVERARTLDGEDFLFIAGRTGSGKNLISNFVQRDDASVHVQPQRLRSTWLVTQMSASTPLTALVEAAGVESLEALTRFLPFVDRPDESTTWRALRAA
jgi:hypothetical protein